MTHASSAAAAANQDPVIVLERLQAELAAVDPEKFHVANFDVAAAASAVLGHQSVLQPLRASLAATFRAFDFTYFDRLSDYAIAVKYLVNAEENARPRVDPAASKALEEGRALRARLASVARMFADLGTFDAGIVADIERTSRGYEGTSNAILRYAALFVDHRDKVEENMPLSMVTVEQARAKAIELGAMGNAPAGKSLEELTDLRRRAVTLFINAYQEVQWAVEYVRRHEGDAAQFVPSVSNHRGSSKSAEDKGETKGESGADGKKDNELPEDKKAEERAAHTESKSAAKPASDKSTPPLPDSPFKRGE